MSKLFTGLVTLSFFLLTVVGSGAAAPPPQSPSNQQLFDQIKQATNNTVRISYHPATGKVNFIGADPGQTIGQPGLLPANASPETAARGFLGQYGPLFGIKDQAAELGVMKTKTLLDGRAFVRFQQRYQGIPIVGGELIVQTDAQQNIISANGEALPDLRVNTSPTISAATARQTALTKVAKIYQLNLAELTATDPELWIYNPVLLDDREKVGFSALVWRTEVSSVQLRPLREFVLIDAQVGVVALNFNQIHTAKNRKIYDNNNNPSIGLPGNGPVRSEGQGPSGINDVNLAYDYSGNTFDFYLTNHNRDSLNGAGLPLISTTRYCDPFATCPYQNAFWNGTQMAYGQGFAAADDVVGHELTHGVTDFESSLFYYYQSGAINESFSDVWGEFIDLSFNTATDNDTAGVRWQMGEDVPGFGVIRNMQNPPAFGDPDRMLSGNYQCDEADGGGVHSNSGVNNKAAFLLTDGGTFNGKTVTALGMAKVADLYYEVQTNLLTSGSNYLDLYNALIQAGVNLGYSAANSQEILDAVNAVQMNQRPCSDPPQPALCTAGNIPFSVFIDNLENPASGQWAKGTVSGSTNRWYYPQNPNPLFDATYTSSGIYNFWGYNASTTGNYFIRMTTSYKIPANAILSFEHDWNFEDGSVTAYDGGIVEYSLNGGSTWTDASALFINNGYNGSISAVDGNPLAGRAAFVRESHGYTTSRLNLNSLAGQNIRFRFRIGTDGFVDDYGWFIDDINIYVCGSPASLTIKNSLPLMLKKK